MLHRHAKKEIETYLKVMPVVHVTGARQTGKTTLVKRIAKERKYQFFTLDDEMTLSSIRQDPGGFISSLKTPVVIDEVQRVPELFLAIKKEVDQNRKNGRFLLTGSANPMLLPRLGDSLAGRMGIVEMFPFSQGELEEKEERFFHKIFAKTFKKEAILPLKQEDLIDILLRGGFPPVQKLRSIKQTQLWMRSYLQTMTERDVRDLANVAALKDFPRLFRLLATRSSALLNVSDISRSLGMVNVTVHRYIRLLETLYFVSLLPAWYTNLGKRLVKSSKLHICDTAILAQLLGVDGQRLQNDPMLMGQFIESFVFTELMKQRSWAKDSIGLYHFRDGNYEVDFVLEKADGTLVGVEVKSAKSLNQNDLKGLSHLKTVAGKRFHRGIVLYRGESIEPLGSELWAVPLQELWD